MNMYLDSTFNTILQKQYKNQNKLVFSISNRNLGIKTVKYKTNNFHNYHKFLKII